MLGQVFDNLVDNAIKYAAAGRWMGVSVATDGSRARIEVSDRGEGVPTDERARIFDKFYRRKGTRLRGAGLGLAIVRRIVEDHRGTVDVTGATGQGTTFVVTLPKAFT
jgi:signal transduction histidine kinase